MSLYTRARRLQEAALLRDAGDAGVVEEPGGAGNLQEPPADSACGEDREAQPFRQRPRGDAFEVREIISGAALAEETNQIEAAGR